VVVIRLIVRLLVVKNIQEYVDSWVQDLMLIRELEWMDILFVRFERKGKCSRVSKIRIYDKEYRVISGEKISDISDWKNFDNGPFHSESRA
jgi:hypothetical protein